MPLIFADPPPYPHALSAGEYWSDTPPRPWRRFFARLVDMSVVGDGLCTALILGLPALLPDTKDVIDRFVVAWQPLPEAVLAVLFVLPINAVSTALFGTTLGKYLFGLRVSATAAPKARLSLRTALRREGRVRWRGQASDLPILSLIANLIAYRRLKETGTTAWDSALDLHVYSRFAQEPRGLSVPHETPAHRLLSLWRGQRSGSFVRDTQRYDFRFDQADIISCRFRLTASDSAGLRHRAAEPKR